VARALSTPSSPVPGVRHTRVHDDAADRVAGREMLAADEHRRGGRNGCA
jgi:hypothetical protein